MSNWQRCVRAHSHCTSWIWKGPRVAHDPRSDPSEAVIKKIEQRVLWLAVLMVHHANHIRENVDGLHVGGHQTSSASVVTILAALYLESMRSEDRISIKPHASPAFHAIQYLLGNLEERHLKAFRQREGLQAYPSRTKDPDGVDFSTGSVGLGATAPNFASLVGSYNESHGFGKPDTVSRFISLIGDAELDEGSVWEAIAEPAMQGLDNLLWVVDLNRQSLDRVIPGIRVRSWREMFAANGWHVVDVKYGARLKAAFESPNGDLLRNCIDGLSNEAYQSLLRLPPDTLREWLPRKSRFPNDLKRLLDRWGDDELQSLFGNLGGHDYGEMRAAFRQADAQSGPAVLFAYTMKGWNLPSMAHPHNHSALLSDDQIDELRKSLDIPEHEMWSRLDPVSPEGKLCAEVALRLENYAAPKTNSENLTIEPRLTTTHQGLRSTQQTFGILLTAITREQPELAARIVTMSPDVASSTNLGGWINKQEVWSRTPREELPEPIKAPVLKWTESPQGQHIELGISENNLFMALGQFGLSSEMFGELLLPVGTLYDPFIRRGLDAFFYSLYAGAKFIVVGTPSGVSLAPEGGIHQSMLTPSIGTELPEIAYYEPCFGQELEWILLDALDHVSRRDRSAYLRLTTKRTDQQRFPLPQDDVAKAQLREQVLQGAYRLIDARSRPGYEPGRNVVHLFASGCLVPEAMLAIESLGDESVHVNLFNVTGPGPLYRRVHNAMQVHSNDQDRRLGLLGDLVGTEERDAPVVTVIDGHPHCLAWIGGALGTHVWPLGVVAFGQSGNVPDIYQAHGIDARNIAATCRKALENSQN